MEFDKKKYKIRTWKHWTMIHWVINPGLLINDLILGQRIPKVILFDKTTGKSLIESQFIPCPHCGKLNDAKLWSKNNAIKNWFGYYCPNCGKIIPCMVNLTSLLIIILTFPVWIWFFKKWKENWLKKQPARFENFKFEENIQQRVSWLKEGLLWGGFMFIIMTLVYPLIQGQTITLKMILTGIPLWILAGLGFGYTMKYWMGKWIKKEAKIE